MTAASGAVGPLVGAAAKSSTGPQTILIFALIGAAFYFLIYRPQQRKAKAAREQGNSFEVGDEVVTAGGIVGRVLDISDDRVTLETSVGASFVVLRPYVLRKLEPVEPPSDVVDGSDDDHEPEPPSGPPELEGTTDAQASAENHPASGSDDANSNDAPVKGDRSKGSPSTGSRDPKGPTTPPPVEDPDDTDASGADGPPII
jgi:preprotein translocase subunit YajC